MTDTIIQTYVQNTDNNAPNGVIHIRFSVDYGETWTDEDKFTDGSSVTGFPMTPHGVSDQNMQSCLIVAPNGYLLMMMWNQDYDGETPIGGGTYESLSSDGGKTWGAPSLVSISGLSAGDNLNTFATDQAVVVGSTIYVSCIHYYDANYNVLIKSVDNGSSWIYVGKISGDTVTGEAGIAYVGGTTMIAILRGENDEMYYTHSSNMGATWAACTQIGGYGTGGRWHLWTRAQLKGEVNWWLDPVLVMCGFLDTSGDGSARQNSVWVSLNRGNTWSQAFALDTPADGNDGGYGDMFYNQNTGEYVAVNYRGLPAAADVKQYNCTINGI